MLSWLQPGLSLRLVAGCMQLGGCGDRKVSELWGDLKNCDCDVCLAWMTRCFQKSIWHLVVELGGKLSAELAFRA